MFNKKERLLSESHDAAIPIEEDARAPGGIAIGRVRCMRANPLVSTVSCRAPRHCKRTPGRGRGAHYAIGGSALALTDQQHPPGITQRVDAAR